MSNLPHPLGITNPGELFYPGPPSITAYDVPGPAGSRAVEFGEDGTSAATNRMGVALAKNDEYIQARMETPIARPTYAPWVPAGGGGGQVVLAAIDLFVGDSSYLPESQDVRDILISVLDSNFNEVMDAFGNHVVVKSIRNAADTDSIVGDQPAAGGDGNGFYLGGAIVRFCTVDPISEVEVLASYTIPDGTNIVLVFGIAGNLDSLVGPFDYFMKDMLVRGTVRASARIPAAAFVRDGSRSMLGDIDMGGHQVVNCLALGGLGTSPLDINNRVGPGDDILFSDKWVSYVPLASTGCESPYTPGSFWPSIMGVLNSGARLNEKMNGNRVLVKNTDIDWQSGYINFPDMSVSVNGESIIIPAQRFPTGVGLVTIGSPQWAVVDATGTIVEKSATTLAPTDVVLAYYLASAGPTWDFKADGRWEQNGSSSLFEVTVAPATYKGADFTNLQVALDCLAGLAYARVGGRFVVRVFGEVELTDTLDITNFPWYFRATIKGDNPFVSVIKTSSTLAAAKHIIRVNNDVDLGDLNRLDLENLSIVWASANPQSAGYAAVYNPGFNTIIKNCVFSSSSSFENAVLFSATNTQASFGTRISNCYFGQVTGSIVDTNGMAYSTVVEDCLAEYCSSIGAAFNMTTVGNKILRTRLVGDVANHFDFGANIGHRGEIGGSYFYKGAGAAVLINNPSLGSVKVEIHDNQFDGATGGFGLAVANNTGQDCLINFKGNYIVGQDYGVFIDNDALHSGSINIENNRFYGQDQLGVYCVDYGRTLNIRGNLFSAQAGNAIQLDDHYDAHVEDNTIEGYGTAAGNFALGLYGSSGRAFVRGNHVFATGGHSTSSMAKIYIKDIEFGVNMFDGDTGAGNVTNLVAVFETASGGTYTGNRFLNCGPGAMLNFYNNTLTTSDRCTISGNVFGQAGALSAQLRIAGFRHMTVVGNVFGGVDASSPVGNGILITKTAIASKYITVEGNTFKSVQGRGSVNGALVNDHDENVGCSYANNVFENCGFTNDVAKFSYAIHTRGLHCTVTGNVIRQLKGPANTGVSGAVAICLFGGQTTCTGNMIYQDVTNSSHPSRVFIGIQMIDHYCTVTGNQLFITGTITGTNRSVYGIENMGTFSWHVVSNNNINYWVNSGVGNVNFAILMGVSEGCTLNGNRSGHYSGGAWYGHNIDCSGGTSNVVIGNFSGGSVDIGLNAAFCAGVGLGLNIDNA